MEQKQQQKQKRKLLQFNGVSSDGRRLKAREDNGEQTATKIEAEVDEFFAIIRQLHSAARYFQKESDNGGVHKLTEKAPNWKPVFELGDFGEKDVNKCRDHQEKKVEEEEEEEEEECADFDLNLDPEADTNSI